MVVLVAAATVIADVAAASSTILAGSSATSARAFALASTTSETSRRVANGSARADGSSVPQVDLGLDLFSFVTRYAVKSVVTPLYRVFPETGGVPFNRVHTPQLLPCRVQRLEARFQVTSVAGGAVVYPQVRVRFYRMTGAPITSRGDSGAKMDDLVINLAPLQPGTAEVCAATPVRPVGSSPNVPIRPKDLPRNRAVRMEISVTPFADPLFVQPVADSNSSNDVISFWLMRAC
jgi:hypothetical protein